MISIGSSLCSFMYADMTWGSPPGSTMIAFWVSEQETMYALVASGPTTLQVMSAFGLMFSSRTGQGACRTYNGRLPAGAATLGNYL